MDKSEVESINRKIIRDEISSEEIDYMPLFFNYDEGPKNSDNIKLFIENDYLVLERGNLYHSLYDLQTQKTLINEESPFGNSETLDKEGVNDWIKENLHIPIKEKLNASR